MSKHPTSIRLSEEGDSIRRELAAYHGVGLTQIVEMALRALKRITFGEKAQRPGRGK